MTRPIYLDHHATTPCAEEVVAAMMPWFTERFGNAGSRSHAWGLTATAGVTLAREQVATLLGADPGEIVFTSGATEANSLAILGVMRASSDTAAARRVVTVSTEHSAVLAPVERLAREGFPTSVLAPGPDGLVSPAALAEALSAGPPPRLVTIMLANNEVGVIQDIPALAEVVHAAGALLHVYAAQAVGKLPVSVRALGADLVSLSAHKMYGPKGVGALWIRRGRPRVSLVPLLEGGGQERGRRAGTLPVPLIVGLGAASGLAARDLAAGTWDAVARRRDRLAAALCADPDVVLTLPGTPRLPHNLHLRVRGVPSARLLPELRPLGVSTGAACSTDNPAPSHVLLGLGWEAVEAREALRFGLGRDTSDEDVEEAACHVLAAIQRVRRAGAATAS